MSALARLLHKEGCKVSGSDSTKSATTELLAKEEINVNFCTNLPAVERAETIVVSSAIPNDNEELVYAKKLGKKIMGRGELLGKIASKYHNVIAVSGAHGKTTTTALIASIFESAGKQPTVHIGGLLCEYDSNLILGKQDYFITEACEYKDNFLYLKPTFGVVLNVEAEHLDYFKTFEGVKCSFKRFVSQCEYCIAPSGFGGNLPKFSAKCIKEDECGLHLKLYREGKFYAKVDCGLFGLHNVTNIIAAVDCADYFRVSKEVVVQGLKAFKGVKRRYEQYRLGKGKVIFDYAHHPTEIVKSIEVTRRYCKGRLTVIFQPHTYSRTKMLFNDFVNCFGSKVDNMIVFKTYSAREPYDFQGDAKRLCEVLSLSRDCKFSEDYTLLETIKSSLAQDDIVLVLGAGDFYDKVNFNILD